MLAILPVAVVTVTLIAVCVPEMRSPKKPWFVLLFALSLNPGLFVRKPFNVVSTSIVSKNITIAIRYQDFLIF